MPIPKTLNVVVTGTPRAGKKAFVNAIREREPYESAAKDMRAYFGRVKMSADLTLFLFPTNPRHHLAFMNQLLDTAILGVIVLVDSTAPESFREVRRILDLLEADGWPYVVAANKQDVAGAWSSEDVRRALQIHPQIPVLPCIAKQRDSIKEVLLALFDVVLEAVRLQETEQAAAQPDDTPPKAPSSAPERPRIKPLSFTSESLLPKKPS